MTSISPVQPNANVAATTTKPSGSMQEATTNTNSSSTVYISVAAWRASNFDNNITGIKVPDQIAQWFNKDFPQDVVDEAQARLDDIKAHGRVGVDGPSHLPLLPENQKLLDSFNEEMNNIRSAGLGNATTAQSERFNSLTNLSMRLQLVGGVSPMSEADVQRELDVSYAMAKLALANPALAPSDNAGKADENFLTMTKPGAVPAAWRDRWQKEGLTMPEQVNISSTNSMWVDLANAAGVGKDEFLSKVHDLASSLKGNNLTHAIESFISDRYAALTESKKAQSA